MASQGGGVYIDITGWRCVRDESARTKEYIVFVIKIRLGSFAWTVYRRFTQFKTLSDQLRGSIPDVPPCPPKRSLSAQTPEFLEQRRAELLEWVRAVVPPGMVETPVTPTAARMVDARSPPATPSPPATGVVAVGGMASGAPSASVGPYAVSAGPVPTPVVGVPISGGYPVPAYAPAPGYSVGVGGVAVAAPVVGSGYTFGTGAVLPTRTALDPATAAALGMGVPGAAAGYAGMMGVPGGHAPGAFPARAGLPGAVPGGLPPAHAGMATGGSGPVLLGASTATAAGSTGSGVAASKKVGLREFTLLKVVGKGSFGKVMQVRKRDTGRVYAMKVLHKANVIRRDQVEHTKTERNVLGRIVHPFIVGLNYAFQTADKLYFVLDYCAGGELFFHLGREGRFSESRARFYSAEIVLALAHLHSLNVIYRDLKPENVLLDHRGNVRLTDFGLSKENVMAIDSGAHSFCGTPEYLAPEVLNRNGHGRGVDWWSLGALLYEMLTGLPPFYCKDRRMLFERIRKGSLEFPDYLSEEAKDILQGLLCRDPTRRLGCGPTDAEELKSHPFFAGMDWEALYQCRVEPPWQPAVSSSFDTSQFDAEFTSMPIVSPSSMQDAPLNSHVARTTFEGFSFVAASALPSHAFGCGGGVGMTGSGYGAAFGAHATAGGGVRGMDDSADSILLGDAAMNSAGGSGSMLVESAHGGSGDADMSGDVSGIDLSLGGAVRGGAQIAAVGW